MAKEMKLSIMLTTACNWRCEYCDIERVPNSTVDLALARYFCENLLNDLDLSNTRVEFTGGEPGYAPVDVLTYFDYVFPNSYICTNGMYLDKGYHKRFSYIPYIHIDPTRFFDYGTEYSYALVVTNNNFVDALKFIKSHPHHNIFAIPCTVRADRSQHINPDYVKVFNTVKPHVSAGSVKAWEQLAGNPDYAACSAYVGKPLIDLCHNKIIRCCCMYEGNELEPLNRESIKRLFSGELYEPKPELCEGCCHVLDVKGV